MHRKEIDGLRGLAVIAVILNHFSKDLLRSGFLGVDVFFVISGYVITASLYGRNKGGIKEALFEFYARRVKRLIPALVLFVLATSILISLVNPQPNDSLKTGALSLFGVSNFFLIWQAMDYFGGSAQLNAFTHTWSLGVEEQFYFFFPTLVWWTQFGQRSHGRNQKFYTILGLLALLSLATFVVFNETKPDYAYYLMPSRFWELAAGSFAFGIVQNIKDGGRAHRVMSTASLILLLAVFAMPESHNTVKTIAAAILTVSLITFIRPGSATFRLLASRAMVAVGLISYSLYLYHWTVLVISRWTVGIHIWTAPIQVVLMILLATVSYLYVEKPLRQATWSARRWATIGYAFVAMTVVAMAILALIKPLGGKLYAGTRPDLAASGIESLLEPHAIAGTVWRSERCILSYNGDVSKVISAEGCTLGDFRKARTRVLVIGNSFSAAFIHAFDSLVTEDGLAVIVTSSWGASPVRELPNDTPWSKVSDYYWDMVVPNLVASLKSGDRVFMVSSLAPLAPEEASAESDANLKTLGAGIEKLSDELAQRGLSLAVLHGLPFAKDANCDPAVAVKQWFAPMGGPCKFFSREASLKRRAPMDTILSGLQANKKIVVVDLFDLFCPDVICSFQTREGTILYRDVWSHPSIEAARLSAPLIRNALNP